MKSSFTFTYEKDLDMVRVSSDSPMLFSSLIDVFTVDNPQYFYLSKNGNAFADETFSAITPTGTFHVGLFPIVYLSALKLVSKDKSRIIMDDEDTKLISERCFPLKGMFDDSYSVSVIDETRPLRWYQNESIETLIKHGRGICVSPTGSGKSMMIATLVHELRKYGFPKMGDRKHILLVVPTRQLVDQMASDFNDYGLGDFCTYTSNSGSKRAGTFKDNSCSDGFKNLIITNHSWIIQKYKEKTFPLNKIGCTIADEVHTVSRGTKILKVVKKVDSTLRFGFTATLPDFVFDRWINFGTFGIPVFQTDIKTLQNEEYLSKLEIYPIHAMIDKLDIHLPFSLSKSRAKLNDVLDDGTVVDVGTAYAMELDYIEKNCSRLYMPVFDEIANNFDFKNRNIVVLFDRITTGTALKEELENKFHGISKVHYIDGTVDVSIREGIRSAMESSNGNILVAQTTTASVGLNIKNLHGIVFAFSGRSYVRILQSIGRVIRQKKDKSVAKLFELWYNLKYSTKHHDEKMVILSENYGKECIKKESVITV